MLGGWCGVGAVVFPTLALSVFIMSRMARQGWACRAAERRYGLRCRRNDCLEDGTDALETVGHNVAAHEDLGCDGRRAELGNVCQAGILEIMSVGDFLVPAVFLTANG